MSAVYASLYGEPRNTAPSMTDLGMILVDFKRGATKGQFRTSGRFA